MKECSQKYTVAIILTVLLVMLTAVPSSVAARGHWDRSYWNNFSRNEVGTTEGQREMFRGLRRSSEFREKIEALPDAISASLSMPVLFGVEVSDIFPNFGDPRDDGARLHEGEDIIAVNGTPIVSPTPAVVIRTGVGSGSGNYVTTANPGGENFVYMHLDRIGEDVTAGTVLTQGSLIGYVGDTGNAIGGVAHLHLEIHDSGGTPTDPFPRLTAEFTAEQKLSFLETILENSSEPRELSEFLVTNFRSTFLDAAESNVLLPQPITEALASVPAETSSVSGNVPAGDLAFGSRGSAVEALQTFLIAKAAGKSAQRLAGAGATGYFGPITESALIEYQKAEGITPAVGYYGEITRARVAADTNVGGQQQPPTTPPPSEVAATFTRNLYYGVSGEDVRTLQQLLNARGYVVATSDAGSPGNETSYFGPATQAAVIRFQLAHSIVPPVGYFGPITRAAIADL